MKKLIFLLSALVITVTGCGWTPMFSNNDKLRAAVQDIYIAPIAGTNGIDLRNRLILAWNTPNNPNAKYTLNVKLSDPTTIYKGLQKTGDATWEEIRLEASWTLSAGKRTIAKSKETASESYTFVSDLISANASKTTATQHAVYSIGDKIEMKVNAKLKNEN